MLQEKIKIALINARKNKMTDEKEIISFLLSKINNKVIELHLQETGITDTEIIGIIQKLLKELEEEIKMYQSASKSDKVELKTRQSEILKTYLPKMLSEQEIKTEINTLVDKSMPSIMKYFKTNFAGKVDMSLVSRIAKGIN